MKNARLATWMVFATAPFISSATAGELDTEFLNPPRPTRPEVIWYWRHELHTKEGITADLEAMNRVGIGGVMIGFIASRNRLTVRVTNPWANRLVGDSALPETQRITRVSYPNPYKPDAPLVPSGLLGPVTILATENATTP